MLSVINFFMVQRRVNSELSSKFLKKVKYTALERIISGLNKNPKIWQFWMPRIIGIEYNAMYIKPYNRGDLGKKIKQVLMLNYESKGKFMFIIPNGLYVGTQRFGRNASVGTLFSRTKMLVKPYVTSVLTSVVGFTFRFKLFLRVKGLGYKAYIANSGKTLNLKLGFSHIVTFNFQNEMFATKLGVKDRMFSVEGSNWIVLTNVVARIQGLKKIDYYRGKGIFKKFSSCKLRISRKKKK